MALVRRVRLFAYAVLLRALAAVGGAVFGYGATAMFTSSGIQPPNAIVVAGLAMCMMVLVALWSAEHRQRGIWPAILIVAIPYSLYAFGSLGQAECAPPYQPITSSYNCAPVGSRAIALVSPILVVVGLVLFVRDLRALAKQ